MKIAFVTPRMIVGGAETYVLRKSKWLIEHGHEVVVISEGGCFVESLPNGARHIQIKNIDTPSYALTRKESYEVKQSLVNALLNEKVEIIEAHNPFPIVYVFMTYAIHKIPFLLNVLSELSYNRNIELIIITRILNSIGKYYTLTSRMNAYIEKKCKQKLHPTIIPIPLEEYIHTSKSLKKPNPEYILTVARLAPDKMYIKYLVKDFAYLHEKNLIKKDISLFIIGDGPLKQEVFELANSINISLQKDVIKLLGTVTGNELDEIYSKCSLYIGVGTTMLIAASHHRPTIMASGLYQKYAFGFWGSEPEKDKNAIGGDDTMFYKRQSFKQIIQDFFSYPINKRQEFGDQAYQLFKQHFDLNVIMPKWEYVYSETSKIKRMPLYIKIKMLLLFNLFIKPFYSLYRFFKLKFAQ